MPRRMSSRSRTINRMIAPRKYSRMDGASAPKSASSRSIADHLLVGFNEKLAVPAFQQAGHVAVGNAGVAQSDTWRGAIRLPSSEQLVTGAEAAEAGFEIGNVTRSIGAQMALQLVEPFGNPRREFGEADTVVRRGEANDRLPGDTQETPAR